MDPTQEPAGRAPVADSESAPGAIPTGGVPRSGAGTGATRAGVGRELDEAMGQLVAARSWILQGRLGAVADALERLAGIGSLAAEHAELVAQLEGAAAPWREEVGDAVRRAAVPDAAALVERAGGAGHPYLARQLARLARERGWPARGGSPVDHPGPDPDQPVRWRGLEVILAGSPPRHGEVLRLRGDSVLVRHPGPEGTRYPLWPRTQLTIPGAPPAVCGAQARHCRAAGEPLLAWLWRAAQREAAGR